MAPRLESDRVKTRCRRTCQTGRGSLLLAGRCSGTNLTRGMFSIPRRRRSSLPPIVPRMNSSAKARIQSKRSDRSLGSIAAFPFSSSSGSRSGISPFSWVCRPLNNRPLGRKCPPNTGYHRLELARTTKSVKRQFVDRGPFGQLPELPLQFLKLRLQLAESLLEFVRS